MEKFTVLVVFLVGWMVSYLISHPTTDKPVSVQKEVILQVDKTPEPVINTSPPANTADTLKVCGNAYIQARADGTKVSWKEFLSNCRVAYETGLKFQPEPEPVKPVAVEKWTNGDELDDRLPRNTKFNLGDVVCLKSHKKHAMVIWDIRPKFDDTKNEWVNKIYMYHVNWFDKNDDLKSHEFYESQLIKCGDE